MAARTSTRPSRPDWHRPPQAQRCCSRQWPGSTTTDPLDRGHAGRRRARASYTAASPASSSERGADLHLVPLAADVREVFDDVLRTFAGAGARLVDVALPEAELVLPAFRTIQSAEALETHRQAGIFPSRRDEYGSDVVGRLDAATEVTLAQYLQASADRERVRAGFARLFRSCDVLLTPVSAGSPISIGEETVMHEGRELTFRDLVMSYTTPHVPRRPTRLRRSRRLRCCRCPRGGAVHGPALARSQRPPRGRRAIPGFARRAVEASAARVAIG